MHACIHTLTHAHTHTHLPVAGLPGVHAFSPSLLITTTHVQLGATDKDTDTDTDKDTDKVQAQTQTQKQMKKETERITQSKHRYGVATVSRIDKIIGLFCRI